MGCAISTTLGSPDGDRGVAAAPATAAGPPPLPAREAAAACCYKPESENARLRAVLDCHQLDTPAERRFDGITSLLKDLLEVPVAVVGLIDDDRLFLKSAAGDAQPGASHDRLHSFCDASLRAPNPRMMVVPDTLEDARFKHNEFVKIGIRSYTGAPLVSSDGHVMGSLGVMDTRPRTFSPSALNILCNFAELVVRELERDKALELQRQQELAALQTRTVRALSCFLDAVCFCDTSEQGWPIRWANDKWEALTGRRGSEGGCEGSSEEPGGLLLWDIFSRVHPELQRQASQARHFRQPLCITVPGPAGGSQLTLELRPATRDHLSALAPTIAVPNFVEGLDPAQQPGLDRLYFIVARPAASPSPFKPPPPPLGQVAGVQNGLGSTHTGPAAAPASDTGSSHLDAMPCSPPSVARDHPARGMLSAGSSASDSRPAYSSLNGSGSSGGTLRPLSSFGLRPPVALAGLHLGPKLGSGSYGHVYRATMGSHMVAVKIIDSKVQPGDGAPTRAMLEALLSQQLQHPCIVRTLTSAWEDSAQGASEWSASEWGHSRWSVASDSASLRSLDSPLLSGVDDDEQCCIAGHPIQQMWIVQEANFAR